MEALVNFIRYSKQLKESGIKNCCFLAFCGKSWLECFESVTVSFCYSGAKVGSQEAFYLYACGPSHTSIMPCKHGTPASDYSKYINKDILQCDQIRELFMTKKDVDIGLLIVSFHFMFNFIVTIHMYVYYSILLCSVLLLLFSYCA